MSFRNAQIVGANVDPAVYRRTDQPRCTVNFPMTRSDIVLFVPCPIRYKNGYQSPDTKAKKTGNLWDPLLLQPDTFNQHFVECPATYESVGMKCPGCDSVTDAKTCRACKCDRAPVKIVKEWNGAANECKDFIAANPGREPVDYEDMAEARAAVSAVHENPVLHDMLTDSERQVMVIAEWTDETSGITIPVKCLIDIVPLKDGHFRNDLWDYKTGRCVAPSWWEKVVRDYWYHVQAAFNLDMFNAATGEERNTFRHLAQEKEHPFHVETHMISTDDVQNGRDFYIAALRKYCRCIQTNIWPGYYSREMIDGSHCISLNPTRLLLASEAVLAMPEEPDEEPAPQPAEENFDLNV